MEGIMRYSRFLQVFLFSVFCLAIAGLAEAGKGGHPEQFPYPYDDAYYNISKNNCRIIANESGRFEVFFPSLFAATSIAPADMDGVRVSLYDPTTMSNSAKKLTSTQTSNLYIEFGTVDPGVERSSMTATADAKKATATVKINDASLDSILVPVSIRPASSSDFRDMLLNAGFKLKLGVWSATCSAKRSVE